MNYVYILRCADGSLYTGWTTDVARRVAAHAAGKGAKYTRAHLPITLVYSEAHESKKEALQREFFIKSLTRIEKLRLIASADPAGEDAQ